MDKDGDGAISLKELSEAMKVLGKDLTEGEVESLAIGLKDKNGNIAIRLKDFVQLIQAQLTNSDEALLNAFRVFDKEGRGYLHVTELRGIVSDLEGISAEEIDEMVQMVDEDGDGEINYEEFVHLMNAKEKVDIPYYIMQKSYICCPM